MKDIAAPQRRVLAYDRVAENKRRARLLIAVFVLISLPASLLLAIYLTFSFVVLVGTTLGVLTAGGALGGDNWGAWAAAVVGLAVLLALLTPVVIFVRATHLVLRLSGARALADGQEPELRRTVENLCIASGLPQPRLYVVDAGAANAFSTGMSPESSSLVVTSGLLQLLERRELEGVVAQEMVQIGNFDTRVSTILAAGIAFLRLPFTVVVAVVRSLFRIHWAVGGFALLYLGLPMLLSVPFGFAAGFSLLDEDPAQAAIVLITMSMPVYVLVIAPLLAEVIRAGVTRQQQFRADADAVLLARSAEPLATALVKMESGGMEGLDAARATAHLWTVEPLPEKPWWEWLWPDYHPPLPERVEMLARLGGGIPPSTLEAAAQAGRGARSDAEPRIQASVTTVAQPLAAVTEAASETPEAYRLMAPETIVYEAADIRSPEVDRLVAGALVTVDELAGDYLRVITPNDIFGYIPKQTAMTPFEAGP
jgi:heat shock protein HtpX